MTADEALSTRNKDLSFLLGTVLIGHDRPSSISSRSKRRCEYLCIQMAMSCAKWMDESSDKEMFFSEWNHSGINLVKQRALNITDSFKSFVGLLVEC